MHRCERVMDVHVYVLGIHARICVCVCVCVRESHSVVSNSLQVYIKKVKPHTKELYNGFIGLDPFCLVLRAAQ